MTLLVKAKRKQDWKKKCFSEYVRKGEVGRFNCTEMSEARAFGVKRTLEVENLSGKQVCVSILI